MTKTENSEYDFIVAELVKLGCTQLDFNPELLQGYERMFLEQKLRIGTQHQLNLIRMHEPVPYLKKVSKKTVPTPHYRALLKTRY